MFSVQKKRAPKGKPKAYIFVDRGSPQLFALRRQAEAAAEVGEEVVRVRVSVRWPG